MGQRGRKAGRFPLGHGSAFPFAVAIENRPACFGTVNPQTFIFLSPQFTILQAKMSLWYKVLYQLGVTPWEEDPPTGETAEQVSTLFDREEEGREPPYGKALDLGCGSGIWSVKLAVRGWQVTGVDVVPKAVRMARERAREAGVNAQFVEGDVTALDVAGIGSGFRFVLDFECFNHLNEVQRSVVGREVSAVSAPDAAMLMLVWAPGNRWPLPSGADRNGIEKAFPGWTVVTEDDFAAQATLPFWLRHIDLRFYRLRRDLQHAQHG